MTKNNHMYMSSEVGVTDLENHEVIQKVGFLKIHKPAQNRIDFISNHGPPIAINNRR